MTQLSSPDIEGVYESNVPLIFRAIVSLGCVCTVSKAAAKSVLNGVSYSFTAQLLVSQQTIESYDLSQLEYKAVAQFPYMEEDSVKLIYLYQSSW